MLIHTALLRSGPKGQSEGKESGGQSCEQSIWHQLFMEGEVASRAVTCLDKGSAKNKAESLETRRSEADFSSQMDRWELKGSMWTFASQQHPSETTTAQNQEGEWQDRWGAQSTLTRGRRGLSRLLSLHLEQFRRGPYR